ncbi:MAG: hypothetical protein MN733_07265, partial [Nitrososphaera sp.]|nr:hypothetical protein [Nitrososphaera sp.]
MRIADTVMLYEEIDILKARMSEHYPHVDKIFVVEAERTHSNRPKPLVYNASDFREWSDKIEHLVVPADKFVNVDFPEPQKKAFDNERVQRFWPHTLKLTEDYDWYLSSDADEIIREFDDFKNWLESVPSIAGSYLKYDNFYYYLNTQFNKPFTVPRLHNLRRKRTLTKYSHFHTYPKVVGQHFSYLGGTKAIQRKLNAFAHFRQYQVSERNINNAVHNLGDLFARADQGEMRRLDTRDHLPKY